MRRVGNADGEARVNRSQFSVWWYLFAFEGRINRTKFWVYQGLAFFVFVPALRAVVALGDVLHGVEDDPVTIRVVETGSVLISLAILVPLLMSALAVGAKRWHDRGKSAWWVLLALVPVVGQIWTLIECGCLKGSEGENRYGPDPLAPTLEPVFE